MDKISFRKGVWVLCAFGLLKTVCGSTPCPALPSTPGIFITCELPSNNTKVPCTGPINGVPKRTVAKYKCEEVASFSENELVCRCRGKWKGMEEFQNYTASCGSIQTSFSLDGPSELNFTQDKIQDLTTNHTISDNVTGFAKDALAYHNYYRKLHGAASLQLNTSLSAAAQKWAEHEVSDGVLQSEPWTSNRTYISNLYALSGPNNFNLSKAARLAVARWYKSGENYDYEMPTANSFSSIIWNSTTDLGVGIASNGTDVVVVCNYWPAGNIYVVDGSNTEYFALFKSNVFPLVNSTSNDDSLSSTTTLSTVTIQ